MDGYWDKLGTTSRAKISFYRTYPSLISRLEQVRSLIGISAGILKKTGLSQKSKTEWHRVVQEYLATQQTITHKARRFIVLMEKYFTDHDHLVARGEVLLCCSDIIESTFGRYKNKGGMKVISADVLSIALYNRNLTASFITQAMLKTRLETVEKWSQKHICHNRYSIMHKMRRELKNEQILKVSD